MHVSIWDDTWWVRYTPVQRHVQWIWSLTCVRAMLPNCASGCFCTASSSRGSGTCSRQADRGRAATLRGRGGCAETKVTWSFIRYSPLLSMQRCPSSWAVKRRPVLSSSARRLKLGPLDGFYSFVGDGGSAAKKQRSKRVRSCWQQLCYHPLTERINIASEKNENADMKTNKTNVEIILTFEVICQLFFFTLPRKL